MSRMSGRTGYLFASRPHLLSDPTHSGSARHLMGLGEVER